MAIVTLDGHVTRAKRFMEQGDIYVAIGHRSEWPDESSPPIPSISDRITDLIAMKKVETQVMVVQDDDNGTIPYMDHKYTPCTPEEAYEVGARWVYCYCTFEYDELPINVAYRQVALQTGVVRAAGVSDAKYVLLPNEIADVGYSEILDNIQPIFRRIDKKEKVGIIAEF